MYLLPKSMNGIEPLYPCGTCGGASYLSSRAVCVLVGRQHGSDLSTFCISTGVKVRYLLVYLDL